MTTNYWPMTIALVFLPISAQAVATVGGGGTAGGVVSGGGNSVSASPSSNFATSSTNMPTPTISGAAPPSISGSAPPTITGSAPATISGSMPAANGSQVQTGSNALNGATLPNSPQPQGQALNQQQILDAQRALNANGYSVSTDGIPGPATQNAVRTFQSQHGLPATGELDSTTLNLMNSGNAGLNKGGATETPSNL